MGTKQDPGEYDCYEKAEPDEPMFVLLARDPVAAFLVREWAELRRLLDVPNDAGKQDEALICAMDMERWRRRR